MTIAVIGCKPKKRGEISVCSPGCHYIRDNNGEKVCVAKSAILQVKISFSPDFKKDIANNSHENPSIMLSDILRKEIKKQGIGSLKVLSLSIPKK